MTFGSATTAELVSGVRPLSITYFSLSFPELTQTFVFNEMRRLRDLGARVSVVATRAPTGEHSELPQAYGFGGAIRYVDPKVRPGRLRRFLIAIRSAFTLAAAGHGRAVARLLSTRSIEPRWRTLALAASLADSRPDIVHCHFGTAGETIARLRAAGLTRAGLSTVFHGYDITQHLDGRSSDIYRELFEQSDAMVPISDLWRRRLIELGAPAGKVATVRLGIDCDAFSFRPRRPLPDEPLRLVSVGRLTEKKGHRYAIEALAALVARRPDLDVRFDIAGSGPKAEELDALIGALGLRDRVTLHGALPHDEVRALLDRAHIFVLHSVTANNGDMEGIPVSIMEAMAMGLAVISTRHSGIPELVEDGESGLLVEECDVAACTAAFEQLLDNPDRIEAMGRTGRAIVERDYDAGKQAALLLGLLRNLAGSTATTEREHLN